MPTERAEYWKAVDRRRSRHEGRAVREVQSIMAKVGKVAVSRMEANGLLLGQMEAEQYINEDFRREMVDFYVRTYERVVSDFAEETFQAVKHTGPGLSKADDDVWLEAARMWIEDKGLEMVVNITDRTQRILQEVVDEALLAGQGVEVVAKAINEQWPEIARLRARRIGRTEIIRASNLGSQTGAREITNQTGMVLNKQWIATRDGRVRSEHIDIDGQTVGLEDPFDVGGEQAMYPADASLSPAMSINCRCTQAYVPA